MPDISDYFVDGVPAANGAPTTDREPLKMGDYIMQVVESTAKEKDDTHSIAFQFEVVSSEHGDQFVGRKHWVDVVMQSPTRARQEIGHKVLGSLVAACQMDKVTDTDALNGHRVKATLKQGKPKQDGGHFVETYFSVDLTSLKSDAKVEEPETENGIVDDEIPWG